MKSSRFVKSVLAVVVLMTGSVIGAHPASAMTSTVTVALTNTSPILGNRYLGDSNGSGCLISSSGSALRYETYQLNVTVPGVYTFTDLIDTPNTDVYVAVYPLGAFNSSNIATNCISTGDDGPALLDLSSATSYTLVAALYSGQAWASSQAIGLDGPGEAYLGAVRQNASTPIPMWMQAYARARQEATCEVGWGASWQPWAVPVSGGWVCTRSVPSLG